MKAMTKQQLADRANVSVRTVYRWLEGIATCTM
jgi:predicted DNA-binding transcriptional regulator YafY